MGNGNTPNPRNRVRVVVTRNAEYQVRVAVRVMGNTLYLVRVMVTSRTPRARNRVRVTTAGNTPNLVRVGVACVTR